MFPGIDFNIINNEYEAREAIINNNYICAVIDAKIPEAPRDHSVEKLRGVEICNDLSSGRIISKNKDMSHTLLTNYVNAIKDEEFN